MNTQVLAVLDASDTVVARFEYAGGRMPVAMVQGGAVYYLAYDQVGSLRAVYTAAGDAVRTVEYDAWGSILSESAAPDYEGLNVPFGFAGGLHDRDTGLVLFGMRNYDPETGRWTSRDPIGLAGGDTDLYAYCANDPVNAVDPSGLCEILTDSVAGFFAGLSVSGPYGDPDPSSWGNGWNNIFEGPQEGTYWGTAQKGAVAIAGAATIIATGAIVAEIAGGVALGGNTAAAGETVLPAGSWPSNYIGRATIDGIRYAEHALERMLPRGLGGRGIPPQVVSDVIRNGTVTASREGAQVYSLNGVRVIRGIADGLVRSVYNRGG